MPNEMYEMFGVRILGMSSEPLLLGVNIDQEALFRVKGVPITIIELRDLSTLPSLLDTSLIKSKLFLRMVLTNWAHLEGVQDGIRG